MREITGKITELGSTSESWGVLSYSHIDIDGKTITGLKIFTSLSRYLHEGTYSTLYVHNNNIVGVKVADYKTKDKTYCTDYQTGGRMVLLGWASILLGIPLIFALGLGILMIIGGVSYIKNGSVASKAREINNAIMIPF